MSSKQRSIRNMFVQPQFQLKLSLYYVVVGGVILSVVGAIVSMQMEEVNRLMNSGALTFQTQTRVNDLMVESLQYAFMGFGVFILFSFGFALITSHRIAGPQVAIKAVIEEIKNQMYDSKRNLRPNDELQEVMQAVKELAATLKEREASNQE